MLKSTYRPVTASQTSTESPLPPGWTEHKAPSGHTYYYNTETKQSTYQRPQIESDEPLHIDFHATQPDLTVRASINALEEFRKNEQSHFTAGRSYQDRPQRHNHQGDRPKTKAPIPNCEPWVLVKTKLGRRFVHNAETKESFWKFPSDVMMAVIEMDRIEWEAKKRAEENNALGGGGAAATGEEEKESQVVRSEEKARDPSPRPAEGEYDSDSYEEVEVTDDEENEEDINPQNKRARISKSPQPKGPVDFDEDDIAWQLAQMENEDNYYSDQAEDYDGQEAAEGEGEDEDEGLPITDADRIALFRSLLDDSRISPYATFDKLIEDSSYSALVIEDPRYTSLPTMSSRREAFATWSRDRIAEQRQMETTTTKTSRQKDPKVSYLSFLARYATPKLYWPEFKRKFKKEPELRDLNLTDKDREKLYREFVAKLKISESDRRKELLALLKGVKEKLTRQTNVDELPDSIIKDVRYYIVVPETKRDEIVAGYLGTMPDR